MWFGLGKRRTKTSFLVPHIPRLDPGAPLMIGDEVFYVQLINYDGRTGSTQVVLQSSRKDEFI